MRLLCWWYAPAMRLLCVCYAPAMRLLCVCYAPAMRPLCARYASAMRLLCGCYAGVCRGWCMPGGRPPLHRPESVVIAPHAGAAFLNPRSPCSRPPLWPAGRANAHFQLPLAGFPSGRATPFPTRLQLSHCGGAGAPRLAPLG